MLKLYWRRSATAAEFGIQSLAWRPLLMSPDTSIEGELLRVLRTGNFEKEYLNELVRAAVEFHREGLRPVKVFPLGIPVVDGVEIRGVVAAKSLVSLLGKVLIETSRTAGVSVFPYGIPNPEIFRVNVRLGGIGAHAM